MHKFKKVSWAVIVHILVLALSRQRQEDEASLVYRASSRTASSQNCYAEKPCLEETTTAKTKKKKEKIRFCVCLPILLFFMSVSFF